MTSPEPPTIPDFATMRAIEIDRWFRNASAAEIETAMMEVRGYLPPRLRVILDYVPLPACSGHRWSPAIRQVHGPGATRLGDYGLLRIEKIEHCLTCGAERLLD